MRPELEIHSNQVWATSNDVAEKFGRKHFHVLRDIKNLLSEVEESEVNASKFGLVKHKDVNDLREFYRLNFEESTYLDAHGEERPSYRMTRDGFTMLVFGFEGLMAHIWKMRYIEKFNVLESNLRRVLYRERTLSDQQVSEIVRVALGHARAEFSLTFAINLMMAKNLHIPPITRDQMIKFINDGEIEGFKRDRQWHVYQDSFAAWLDKRKAST